MFFFPGSVLELLLQQLAQLEVKLGASAGAAGLLEGLHRGDRRLDLARGDVGLELGFHQPRVARARLHGLGLDDRIEQLQGLGRLAGFGEHGRQVADVADQARIGWRRCRHRGGP